MGIQSTVDAAVALRTAQERVDTLRAEKQRLVVRLDDVNTMLAAALTAVETAKTALKTEAGKL